MNHTHIAQALVQSNDRTIISTIQGLLYLMKKFGKSLNQPEVLSSLQDSFPDIIQLYSLLGKGRYSVAQCQSLLLYVCSHMDQHHLDVTTSDAKNQIVGIDGDTIDLNTNNRIGLSVSGKGKIYKRTLNTDLEKMINA